MKNPSDSVTMLLADVRRGDPAAESKLFRLVDRDLRKIAQAKMATEGKGHTLQATALVNEVFLRLCGQTKISANDRRHLFSLFNKVAEQVLIDHARKKRAAFRGGKDQQRVPLDEHSLIDEGGVRMADPYAARRLRKALKQLAAEDPETADLMKRHYIDEIPSADLATSLGISQRMIQRRLNVGMLMLRKTLSELQ